MRKVSDRLVQSAWFLANRKGQVLRCKAERFMKVLLARDSVETQQKVHHLPPTTYYLDEIKMIDTGPAISYSSAPDSRNTCMEGLRVALVRKENIARLSRDFLVHLLHRL